MDERTYGKGGSQAGQAWGSCHPPTTRALFRERTARLPDGVIGSRPVPLSLTPSITAIAMPFFLDEQTSAALEQPLRANYSTRTERSHLFRRRQILPHILFDTAMWQGYRIHGPDSQGRAAVKAGIEELERRCIRWVSSHLPGVFSSHVLGQDFPTAVLLVTEVATPATAEARAVRGFLWPFGRSRLRRLGVGRMAVRTSCLPSIVGRRRPTLNVRV